MLNDNAVRNKFRILGGILQLLTALAITTFGVYAILAFKNYFIPLGAAFLDCYMGILGIGVSIFGLLGGVVTLKGRHFDLAIFGVVCTLAWDVVLVEQILVRASPLYYLVTGLGFAFSVAFLSILSIVSVAFSRADFI